MYAVIILNNHQYKISPGSILKIFNLKFNINDCFLINNILLLNYNNRYYFNDNYFLKNIFILCRILKIFYKKYNILKMKRRKHNLKIKRKKILYNKIIIEKFFFNLNK